MGFGRVQAVAVESTSSYAAGLTRALLAHRIEVLEVNQPHAHTRRRRGKTDAIDAETAARRYLTGEGIAIPKHTSGVVESIRMLRVARQGAVKARTAAQLQARDLITTAPQQLREQMTRYRKTQIAERQREANRLHKALEDTGIKLDCVASDILGKSGRAMLDALVAGTTDPEVLADLARGVNRPRKAEGQED